MREQGKAAELPLSLERSHRRQRQDSLRGMWGCKEVPSPYMALKSHGPLSWGNLAWQTSAPSPFMSLSLPRFRIHKGPMAKSPAFLALESPPDLWSSAEAAREHQAAWVRPFLGQDTRAGTGTGAEAARKSKSAPSLPEHSVLCSRLPHTVFPSFLPPKLAPGGALSKV